MKITTLCYIQSEQLLLYWATAMAFAARFPPRCACAHRTRACAVAIAYHRDEEGTQCEYTVPSNKCKYSANTNS